MVDDLDLAARELGELVDELLCGQRRAVLGRIDVAHRQVLALGLGGTVRSGRSGEREQGGRQQATLGDWHFAPPGDFAPKHPVIAERRFRDPADAWAYPSSVAVRTGIPNFRCYSGRGRRWRHRACSIDGRCNRREGMFPCCVEICSPLRCCWLPRRPSRNGCPSSRSRSWSATRRAALPTSPRGSPPTPSSASTAIPSSSTTRPAPAASSR